MIAADGGTALPSAFQILPMELPSEFVERMQLFLGEEQDAFFRCYEGESAKALRFNPLKPGLDEEKQLQILKKLKIAEQERVSWADNAFYFGAGAQPGKHPYHEAGLYYIQEPSAMSAAALLAPRPGERVLDLCAAPGGKTTQMASAMRQSGLLVANEIHPVRAKALSQNIERMGIRNVVVTNEESGRLAARLGAYFHRILVDAPCSGEGMFRKNPDAAAEWSKEQVLLCAKRQKEILANAAEMLLPGGKLLYSTCTFSREENEDVIGWFLEEHPEFTLEKSVRLWPHKVRGEGHFAALLARKGELPQITGLPAPESSESAFLRNSPWERAGEKPSWRKAESARVGRERSRREAESARAGRERSWREAESARPGKELMALCGDFLSQNLTKEAKDRLMDAPFALFGEQLYRLPEETPPLAGLRVLRPGLHVGTFKKNRFEPSHALALFLGEADVKNCVRLTTEEERTAAYYRGESLTVPAGKGWQLVCIDGYSAGWGKLSGTVLKNHYPKGLRKGVSYGGTADLKE